MKNLLILVLFLMSAPSFAEKWNGANDPANFASDFEYKYSKLPLQAALPVEQTPWAETYWPAFKGSINFRWNSPLRETFNYASPTKEEVKAMTRDQLMLLSPAEKYDLAMGRYDFPLKREAYQHAGADWPEWAGICHGWAPAAIQYREPKPVDFTNPDGIVIPFGSSDVKGLLSYFIAFHGEIDVVFAGRRCKRSGPCSDINPGALHVILTNEIGLRGQPVIADITGGKEVWNQPVYAFQMVPVASSIVEDPNGSGVDINLIMTYTDELAASQWLPTNATPLFKASKMVLSYTLELNRDGEITGGKWKSGNIPDFFWKPTRTAPFTGEFAGLNQIYQPN